jgi:hypothetical protein
MEQVAAMQRGGLIDVHTSAHRTPARSMQTEAEAHKEVLAKYGLSEAVLEVFGRLLDQFDAAGRPLGGGSHDGRRLDGRRLMGPNIEVTTPSQGRAVWSRHP